MSLARLGIRRTYRLRCASLGRDLSTDGGTRPLWSPDGRELFYWNRERLFAVPVSTHSGFEAGEPRLLMEVRNRFRVSASSYGYDIHPDGRRFAIVVEGETSPPTQVNLIQNWFEELERLVPTN